MTLPKFTIKSIHDIAQIHKFTMFIYKVDPGATHDRPSRHNMTGCLGSHKPLINYVDKKW